MSTIQLDFQLPQRFDLEYQAADGTRQRPIMIHRALMGSLERFVGVLIEHYAGVFPLWFAPVQARILNITDDQAKKIALQAVPGKIASIEIERKLGGKRLVVKVLSAANNKAETDVIIDMLDGKVLAIEE